MQTHARTHTHTHTKLALLAPDACAAVFTRLSAAVCFCITKPRYCNYADPDPSGRSVRPVRGRWLAVGIAGSKPPCAWMSAFCEF
jgi:hypothetical protein